MIVMRDWYGAFVLLSLWLKFYLIKISPQLSVQPALFYRAKSVAAHGNAHCIIVGIDLYKVHQY